jgi:hypothetical protein
MEQERIEKQKREEEQQESKEKRRTFQIYFDTQQCTISTKSIEELKKNCSQRLSQEGLEPKIEIVKTPPSNSSSTILVVSFMSFTTGRGQTQFEQYTSEMLNKFGGSFFSSIYSKLQKCCPLRTLTP